MKTIVITGAQQGIGLGIVEHFAKLNWNVVINDKNNIGKLNNVAKYLEQKYKIEVLACFGDVSKESFVNDFCKAVYQKFKSVDVVVNNAAIVTDMDLIKRSEQIFNQTLINNTTSVFLMSKIFGKKMKDDKSGGVINISSTNADRTIFPTSIDYDASKAAINSLTRNFAIELAPFVRVNAIMPGWVLTEMNAQLDKKFLESERKKILLNKFQTTTEIAAVVEFLSSDGACAITGALIPVDGGLNVR